jgi:galactose mutarotase-like enzyme
VFPLVPLHAATSMSVVRLSAKRWDMEIRPERGGRITSLRLDGEELLDQGIGVDQPTASGFVEGGAFGWDEMVPNLEPTATLPDHGEAWQLPWTVLGDGAMRCSGRLVTWQLERRIALAETVDVSYTYANFGDRPHVAFWCAHPLFRFETGMMVSVPLPEVVDGASAKVFLPAGSVDRVRLGRVELAWDAVLCPDVAIWVCNGDLGGYRQIAVEPSWTKAELAPGQTYSWWLQIRPI